MIGYRNHFLPIYDKLSNNFFWYKVSVQYYLTLCVSLCVIIVISLWQLLQCFSLHMNAVLAEVKTWNTDKVQDHYERILKKQVSMTAVQESLSDASDYVKDAIAEELKMYTFILDQLKFELAERQMTNDDEPLCDLITICYNEGMYLDDIQE